MLTFKEFIFSEYLNQTLGQERTQKDYMLWKETVYTDEWLEYGQQYGDYIKQLMKGAIDVSTL